MTDLGNIAWVDNKYGISSTGFKRTFLEYLMKDGYSVYEVINTYSEEYQKVNYQRAKDFVKDCKIIGLSVEVEDNEYYFKAKITLPVNPALKVLYGKV